MSNNAIFFAYGASGLQSALVAPGPEHLDGAGVQVDGTARGAGLPGRVVQLVGHRNQHSIDADSGGLQVDEKATGGYVHLRGSVLDVPGECTLARKRGAR